MRPGGRPATLGCAPFCACAIHLSYSCHLGRYSFLLAKKQQLHSSAVFSATGLCGDDCFLPVRSRLSGASHCYVFPAPDRCVGPSIEGIWCAIPRDCIAGTAYGRAGCLSVRRLVGVYAAQYRRPHALLCV